MDNGVNQYDGEAKYKISSTIGARVGRLNPSWNAPDKSPEAEMKGFEKGKLKIIVVSNFEVLIIVNFELKIMGAM